MQIPKKKKKRSILFRGVLVLVKYSMFEVKKKILDYFFKNSLQLKLNFQFNQTSSKN